MLRTPGLVLAGIGCGGVYRFFNDPLQFCLAWRSFYHAATGRCMEPATAGGSYRAGQTASRASEANAGIDGPNADTIGDKMTGKRTTRRLAVSSLVVIMAIGAVLGLWQPWHGFSTRAVKPPLTGTMPTSPFPGAGTVFSPDTQELNRQLGGWGKTPNPPVQQGGRAVKRRVWRVVGGLAFELARRQHRAT